MMHDFLTRRGLRERSEISLVMPMGVPIPPSPPASEALLVAFAERGINWHPGRAVREIDPARKVAILSDGTELPYDLFLGVPRHRVPAVVEESGMTVDGWIPVDSLTLETAFPGRLRSRRRHQRRHAESRGLLRGPGGGGRRADRAL